MPKKGNIKKNVSKKVIKKKQQTCSSGGISMFKNISGNSMNLKKKLEELRKIGEKIREKIMEFNPMKDKSDIKSNITKEQIERENKERYDKVLKWKEEQRLKKENAAAAAAEKAAAAAEKAAAAAAAAAAAEKAAAEKAAAEKAAAAAAAAAAEEQEMKLKKQQEEQKLLKKQEIEIEINFDKDDKIKHLLKYLLYDKNFYSNYWYYWYNHKRDYIDTFISKKILEVLQSYSDKYNINYYKQIFLMDEIEEPSKYEFSSLDYNNKILTIINPNYKKKKKKKKINKIINDINNNNKIYTFAKFGKKSKNLNENRNGKDYYTTVTTINFPTILKLKLTPIDTSVKKLESISELTELSKVINDEINNKIYEKINSAISRIKEEVEKKKVEEKKKKDEGEKILFIYLNNKFKKFDIKPYTWDILVRDYYDEMTIIMAKLKEDAKKVELAEYLYNSNIWKNLVDKKEKIKQIINKVDVDATKKIIIDVDDLVNYLYNNFEKKISEPRWNKIVKDFYGEMTIIMAKLKEDAMKVELAEYLYNSDSDSWKKLVDLEDKNEQMKQMKQFIKEIDNEKGGGRTNKKRPKKEILGEMRSIYKIQGDRKEYVKHKGNLITIKDYKELMKAKKQKKPAKLSKKK